MLSMQLTGVELSAPVRTGLTLQLYNFFRTISPEQHEVPASFFVVSNGSKYNWVIFMCVFQDMRRYSVIPR
jgi:hypothetical protein